VPIRWMSLIWKQTNFTLLYLAFASRKQYSSALAILETGIKQLGTTSIHLGVNCYSNKAMLDLSPCPALYFPQNPRKKSSGPMLSPLPCLLSLTTMMFVPCGFARCAMPITRLVNVPNFVFLSCFCLFLWLHWVDQLITEYKRGW
jgi:hypothetical protein